MCYSKADCWLFFCLGAAISAVFLLFLVGGGIIGPDVDKAVRDAEDELVSVAVSDGTVEWKNFSDGSRYLYWHDIKRIHREKGQQDIYRDAAMMGYGAYTVHPATGEIAFKWKERK